MTMTSYKAVGAALLLGAQATASVAGPQPVLLELFTSQGCYSCPPAERILADRYVGRDDVLAIELHVDYWDDLVYGGGVWKDPYSSPVYTRRQFEYANSISRNPFTPQAIVQGAYSTTGTNKNALDKAISEVKELDLAVDWDVTFAKENGEWTADIVSTGERAIAFSVTYLHKATTVVTAGENKGKTLENHNIATSFISHGNVSAGDRIPMGSVGPDESCALIIQRPVQGVVLGVWPCGA